MFKLSIAFAVALFSASTTIALAEDLPPGAKQVTMKEFQKVADGKKLAVRILDFEKPIEATLTWNWKKKRIIGEAKLDGSTFPVNAKLSFKGDNACSTNKGEPTTCHKIFVDGDKFYEVTDSGTVHAVSTLSP